MEGDTRPNNDPDDDSVESVHDELEQVERELQQHGQSAPDSEDIFFSGLPTNTETFSEALGNVGLYNADDITPERLSKADPEILEKLTPHTVESVYFHTFRKSRKWLGNEPVRLSRLIRQTRALRKQGINLETFQLLQRLRDLEYLKEVGINPNQLLKLLSGTQGERQNINRLAFMLAQEPRLHGYVKRLKDTAEEEGPWGVEGVVIEAQEVLKNEREQIELKSSQKLRESWDSIDEDLYQRVMHRMGSMIAIGHVILHDMRSDTTLDTTLDITE
jgi:DNA-binding transcriptional MerR regulator